MEMEILLHKKLPLEFTVIMPPWFCSSLEKYTLLTVNNFDLNLIWYHYFMSVVFTKLSISTFVTGDLKLELCNPGTIGAYCCIWC